MLPDQFEISIDGALIEQRVGKGMQITRMKMGDEFASITIDSSSYFWPSLSVLVSGAMLRDMKIYFVPTDGMADGVGWTGRPYLIQHIDLTTAEAMGFHDSTEAGPHTSNWEVLAGYENMTLPSTYTKNVTVNPLAGAQDLVTMLMYAGRVAPLVSGTKGGLDQELVVYGHFLLVVRNHLGNVEGARIGAAAVAGHVDDIRLYPGDIQFGLRPLLPAMALTLGIHSPEARDRSPSKKENRGKVATKPDDIS